MGWWMQRRHCLGEIAGQRSERHAAKPRGSETGYFWFILWMGLGESILGIHAADCVLRLGPELVEGRDD